MTAIPINLDSAARHSALNAAINYRDTTRRRLLIVFLVSLVLPIQPELSGLRVDPYRILMLVLFLPSVIGILKHRAGQVTIVDVMMGCYALWIVVTLVFHHGMARFAYA